MGPRAVSTELNPATFQKWPNYATTLVRMAREHVEAGRYDRAIALLQGDMPATPRPDIP